MIDVGKRIFFGDRNQEFNGSKMGKETQNSFTSQL